MDLPGAGRRSPLAHPTSSRIFRIVADARRPLSSAEVADEASVHPNSARLHLERLHRAGLLDLGHSHGGRGRPRKLWTVAAGARIDGEPPESYRELAALLSRSVSAIAADPGAIRAQGRRIGREIAISSPGIPTAEVLGASLAAMGFQPRRADRGSRTRFTLCNCPYREVAKADPGVVCSLHLGIAEGVAQAGDPTSKLTEFTVNDPYEAGCAIEIESPATHTPTEVSG